MPSGPAHRRPRRLGALLALMLAAAVLPALGLATSGPAQAGAAPARAGSLFDELSGFTLAGGDDLTVRPKQYAAFKVDLGQVRRKLASAPSGAQAQGGSPALRFSVPDPSGALQDFSVVEDSVMEPGLQAQHPEIRSYAGRSVSGPARSIRLDTSPLGFHASVRSPGGGASWYVDPAYRRAGTTTHLSYYGASVPRDSQAFVERDLADTAAIESAAPSAAAAPGTAVTRKVFRLAFVTDPTYAKYFGTVNVLAAKNTLLNRTDQIYNDDLAIKFVLIDGTDKLNLDTAAKATEPNGPCGADACYTADELSTCSGSTLDRNSFVLGQLVGADTFDLGHIGLGVNGGGIAGLGVVGTSSKASGCTGLPTPKGDFYAVDYFSHEVGHEMGGNHTFNGTQVNCSLTNRNGDTSVEPGSGTSVMAYAGICGSDNTQPHSDPYFSQRSIDEITATTSSSPSTYDEVQTATLAGFDTDGDSFALTYPGQDPVTITRGAASYNTATVTAAVQQLTGCLTSVSDYDDPSTPTVSDNGFTVAFQLDTCSGTDLGRLGVGATTGGVSGFVGVTTNGGPGTNQGGSSNPSGNKAPVVTAPADKTIPTRTPFTLQGSGTDADGNELTFLWEQNDIGTPTPNGGTGLVDQPKMNGPLFRVFGTYADVTKEGTLQTPSPGENIATGNASRTFPDITQVLADNTNAETGACPAPPADPATTLPRGTVDCFSEFLPTADYGDPVQGRTLHFRLTARDQTPAGGGTAYDDVALSVDSGAGPFQVTSRATPGDAARGGSTENITWDVNGTAADGLAPMVTIRLSTDGGQTFPEVLAAGTENDGAESVTLPQVSTEHARIKIEAVDNYFFDVNDADFVIQADPPADPPADTTAPDTTITTGPAAESFVLGFRTLFRFASTEAGSTFRCALDGTAVPCGRSVTLKGLKTGTHLLSVAASDAAGNADPTPVRRRFAAPFNDGQLTRLTNRWQRHHDQASYRLSYIETSKSGQVLSRQGTRIKKIALVATHGPGMGRVAVYLGDQLLRRVDLARPTTQKKVLIKVASYDALRKGNVRIVTLDDKRVQIDGLGILTH